MCTYEPLFYLSKMSVMEKLPFAPTSNNRTPLSFRSGRLFPPSHPFMSHCFSHWPRWCQYAWWAVSLGSFCWLLLSFFYAAMMALLYSSMHTKHFWTFSHLNRKRLIWKTIQKIFLRFWGTYLTTRTLFIPDRNLASTRWVQVSLGILQDFLSKYQNSVKAAKSAFMSSIISNNSHKPWGSF